MQDYHPQLGERRSVHRASLAWVLLLVLCVAPLLLLTSVAALYAVNSFVPVLTESKGDALSKVTGPFACLGGSGLLLALVVGVFVGDFRKWSATRTVRLIIYQKGFTYESKGHMESCQWFEIKDIDFRRIEVKSKHSAARKVRVIRSIVKRDGRVISLAETLKLEKITGLITTAREKREGLVI
jgi:hypothetical protein